MENSGKILFENDKNHWYVAMGDRWVGPLTAAEVYEKVVQQEITWAHFVWKPGQSEWKRICDTKTFQGAVPTLPQKKFQNEVKEEASRPIVKQVTAKRSTPPDVSLWFLFYNESQFGPFSRDEIQQALKAGKITPKVFGWKDGMTDWKRLEDLTEFAGVLPSASGKAPPPPPAGSTGGKKDPHKDQRKAPRRPLVAKIVMARGDRVLVGVCRDISVGGLQVLTDKPPTTVGERVKLNVSADGIIDPFVAEGVVVRVLEDRRGFSFRFDKLTEESKKAVENYIHAAGL